MSDTVVTISLPEMVDLALSSPEVGAVNFNILHSLLHVIIRQIDLSDIKIQFKGCDGKRIQNLMEQMADAINLTEYMVMSGEKPTKSCKRKSKKSSKDKEGPTSISSKNLLNTEDGVASPVSDESIVSSDKTVIIQNSCIKAEKHVSFNKEFKQLKEDVKSLKELPANSDLFEALRPNNKGPVLEMYQILNLSKRTDATEIGLTKLASMLEDLAKEQFDCCSKLDYRLQATEETDKCSFTDSRLSDVEQKLREHADQLGLMNSAFSQDIKQLQEYLTDLEKEIGEIIEMKTNRGKEPPCNSLFNNVMEIQEELLKLSKTVTALWDEKGHKQESLDTMIEQIELLKIVKADREDLEDALANKADTCAVNRKVSHDQFEATCEELNRAIQEALLKLKQQECMWQQALCDIQTEIENKLNISEFMPLRDFVNSNIQMLQDRLKAIAALNKESEAAGTKCKYLRNVQCVSCDNKTIMRKEFDPAMFPPPATPTPARGMGPYLAYELDQLRSQRRITQRNYHTEAMKDADEKANPVCNRYCGGSHTTTTPRQRVGRVGHFLDQWASALKPELDTTLIGTDGQIYKSKESASDYRFKQEKLKREEFLTIKSDIISERSSSKLTNNTNRCKTK